MATSGPESLAALFPAYAHTLLDSSGLGFVQRIGLEATREVVLAILSGKNLRDSTETFTRRRLALLNGALLAFMLEAETQWPGFTRHLPAFAADRLQERGLSKTEKLLAQWLLGLTSKGMQNVLRDDKAALSQYQATYATAILDAVKQLEANHGHLNGSLNTAAASHVVMTWEFMTYLLAVSGAQTLSIRGSEKSIYGKLFEPLVLGALLAILGFKHVAPHDMQATERIFWLSDRSGVRESDATVLFERGKGIRFDIGFIGRGNPEITLDKVSRFQRRIELGQTHWYMATIILVDRIGRGSTLQQRASSLDGTVIQMSGSYWPQQVAQHLHNTLGFEHPLVLMPTDKIANFLRATLAEVPIEDFVPGLDT